MTISHKKLFECFHNCDEVWEALHSDTLESSLKKAKELEKEYEWLQATKLYNAASNLALKEKASLKAAEL